MKRFAALWGMLWLAMMGCSAAFGGTGKSLALTHVTIVDTEARTLVPDRTVIVTSGRISSIGPAQDAKLPKDIQVVDGRGKFLSPGLWDMHVHLAGVSAD